MRKAITRSEAGLGDLIFHKKGHGLDLEVHEARQVMVRNATEFAQGMIA